MSNAVVVTDSRANLPPQLAQALGIRVVPVYLHIDGTVLRDGVDITAEQLYHLLLDSTRLPTTAAPSIGDFLRTFAQAAQEVSGVVSIRMSPKLSSVHQAALHASQLVVDVPIRVVDCRTVAMGQGFVVLEANRAAASGASLDQVVARAQEVAAKVAVLAIIDTLEYLHRGGRIGGAAALLGSLVQIKPIVTVADGRVEVLARTRTKARAVCQLLEHMTVQVAGKPLHAAVLHAAVPDEAEALRQEIDRRFSCVELYVTDFTPVMGTHAGPGV